MRNVRALLWLFPAAAGVTLIAYGANKPTRVAAVRPEEKIIAETLAVSGEVRGQIETNVGAKVSGRVAEVRVRAGAKVRSGTIIARIDSSVLQAEVARAVESLQSARIGIQQAESALQSAEASLTLASRPPLTSDIARVRAEATQNLSVAEARVVAARQKLEELTRGATTEQREQIAAQVAQAESAFKKAERDANRRRNLYEGGAISRAEAEDAESTRENARQALANLEARQREILTGTRTEQIEQARADLISAEANRDGVKASGAAQIASILALPRPEDIAVARARREEARVALEGARARFLEASLALTVAQTRVAETVVTAPFDGTVTAVLTEEGGVTGPNQPLVKLVRTQRSEIHANIDENDLGKLRIGQKARITAGAYPDKAVDAQLSEIGSEVNTNRGQVEVKLVPQTEASWLRPGQTVTVNLIVNDQVKSLIVPISAVATAGNVPEVMVIENRRTVKRRIQVGASSNEGIVVTAGLDKQSLIVREANATPAGVTVEATLQ